MGRKRKRRTEMGIAMKNESEMVLEEEEREFNGEDGDLCAVQCRQPHGGAATVQTRKARHALRSRVDAKSACSSCEAKPKQSQRHPRSYIRTAANAAARPTVHDYPHCNTARAAQGTSILRTALPCQQVTSGRAGMVPSRPPCCAAPTPLLPRKSSSSLLFSSIPSSPCCLASLGFPRAIGPSNTRQLLEEA
jgi:hypothetical protein